MTVFEFSVLIFLSGILVTLQKDRPWMVIVYVVGVPTGVRLGYLISDWIHATS